MSIETIFFFSQHTTTQPINFDDIDRSPIRVIHPIISVFGEGFVVVGRFAHSMCKAAVNRFDYV